MRGYTAWEEEFLKTHYATGSQEFIQSTIKKQWTTIREKARSMNLRRERTSVFSSIDLRLERVKDGMLMLKRTKLSRGEAKAIRQDWTTRHGNKLFSGEWTLIITHNFK